MEVNVMLIIIILLLMQKTLFVKHITVMENVVIVASRALAQRQWVPMLVMIVRVLVIKLLAIILIVVDGKQILKL